MFSNFRFSEPLLIILLVLLLPQTNDQNDNFKIWTTTGKFSFDRSFCLLFLSIVSHFI